MRAVLIAAAVTLTVLVVSMAVGLQQPAEIGTALQCELIEDRAVCWESP